MENEVKELHIRVTRLEEWKTHLDIERAKEQVDREYIKQRFDTLENVFKDFKENISFYARWAFLLITGAMITGYILPFVFSGKLTGIH